MRWRSSFAKASQCPRDEEAGRPARRERSRHRARPTGRIQAPRLSDSSVPLRGCTGSRKASVGNPSNECPPRRCSLRFRGLQPRIPLHRDTEVLEARSRRGTFRKSGDQPALSWSFTRSPRPMSPSRPFFPDWARRLRSNRVRRLFGAPHGTRRRCTARRESRIDSNAEGMVPNLRWSSPQHPGNRVEAPRGDGQPSSRGCGQGRRPRAWEIRSSRTCPRVLLCCRSR